MSINILKMARFFERECSQLGKVALAADTLTYSSALRELKKEKELVKIFKDKYKEVFDKCLIEGEGEEAENNALSAAVVAVEKEDSEVFKKFDKNNLDDDAVSTSRDSEFMDHAYYGLAPFTGDGEYPNGHIADVETTYQNRADYQLSGITNDEERVDNAPEIGQYSPMSAATNITGPLLGGGYSPC